MSMAIEAPYSKYRKQNLVILAVISLALAVWCVYDGYINDNWIQEHTNPDGSPQSYLAFNRKAPPYFVAAAVVLVIGFFAVRNKKIVADEDELVITSKEKIPYAAIEKIDKTHFDTKGFFIITYKGQDGKAIERKLTYKAYDNLKPVLEHLVGKIS